MKPPAFEYVRAGTTEEAVAELARAGEDARLLAGGQSLMPILNMRLAMPRRLIDLNRVGELAYIREREDGVAIGAMTRQRAVEKSTLVALREALNGRHLTPVCLHGQGQAGPDRLAVEQHRAGPADPVLAADVGAGQAEVVAEEVREEQARRHALGVGAAVDADRHRDLGRGHGVLAGAWWARSMASRRARTVRVLARRRRYSAVP